LARKVPFMSSDDLYSTVEDSTRRRVLDLRLIGRAPQSKCGMR
jgi:hypothetical protein